MEVKLKRDVIKEVMQHGDRILLHDEVEERGVFSIVPQWVMVNLNKDDIMTPRDVFELMAKEGFKVRVELNRCRVNVPYLRTTD